MIDQIRARSGASAFETHNNQCFKPRDFRHFAVNAPIFRTTTLGNPKRERETAVSTEMSLADALTFRVTKDFRDCDRWPELGSIKAPVGGLFVQDCQSNRPTASALMLPSGGNYAA